MHSSEWRLFILCFGKKTHNGGTCYCGSAVQRARWLLSGWGWPLVCPPSSTHSFHKHMKTNSTENSSSSPQSDTGNRVLTGWISLISKGLATLRILILQHLCHLSRGFNNELCLSFPASAGSQCTASHWCVNTDLGPALSKDLKEVWSISF